MFQVDLIGDGGNGAVRLAPVQFSPMVHKATDTRNARRIVYGVCQLA